nr:testican-1 isoform X8 [Equus asinus]
MEAKHTGEAHFWYQLVLLELLALLARICTLELCPVRQGQRINLISLPGFPCPRMQTPLLGLHCLTVFLRMIISGTGIPTSPLTKVSCRLPKVDRGRLLPVPVSSGLLQSVSGSLFVMERTPLGAAWRHTLDPSKDPCLKVKCSPHKVCVTQDYQTALCISRKHLFPRQKKGNVAHKHWVGPSNLVKCKPCPVAPSAMVCGSDGHTYTSKCKLEFHACSTGKSLTTLCDGPCPCLPEPEPPKHKAEKNACTDKELRNLASRLKDWFGALHEDANRVIKPTSSDTAQGRFDTSILPICKDSLGWMFNKLDMNYDLLLDHSEINAIYLDKYEPCIKPLFYSCDSFKDGKLSNNEWCYCFQKPGGLPCQNEMNRIQKLSKGKSLLGLFQAAGNMPQSAGHNLKIV